MREMPRTEDGSKFATKYTDDAFIEAVKETLAKATVSAAEVANMVGCNPRYAKDRLLELVDKGELEGEMKGKAWGFRLRDK